MGLAIVGCGYVAHFYARNASFYPDLEIRGGFDHGSEQAEQFCRYFSIRAYPSLETLLKDESVHIVLNLTNPRSHFAVTEECLRAGKHVYSEKPLGMSCEEALRLAELAEKLEVRLSCAPCSVLNDTAQTLWSAIAEGAIGKVRLVYANFDAGMIARNQSPWNWKVESGAHWPARDEFEVGCTYEHAGYFLTWLGAFFGPAQRVHAFSSYLMPDKGIMLETMAPDFSVGCIEYPEGVVARVTCGLVAPRDKSMTVVGDEGVLYVRDLRNDSEPVYWRKNTPSRNIAWIVEKTLNRFQERFRAQLQRSPWPIREILFYERYPPARRTSFRVADRGKSVDFFRGPKEMADAIRENRPHRLSAAFGVHIVELIEALQYPPPGSAIREVRSQFGPIAPLLWHTNRLLKNPRRGNPHGDPVVLR